MCKATKPPTIRLPQLHAGSCSHERLPDAQRRGPMPTPAAATPRSCPSTIPHPNLRCNGRHRTGPLGDERGTFGIQLRMMEWIPVGENELGLASLIPRHVACLLRFLGQVEIYWHLRLRCNKKWYLLNYCQLGILLPGQTGDRNRHNLGSPTTHNLLSSGSTNIRTQPSLK